MQQSPSAYLILQHAGRWNDVFQLQSGQELVVGRGANNPIVVADDRASRQHAAFLCIGNEWVVRDLGSRNGTFVNSEPIQGDHRLKSGDVVQVAGCRMTFTTSLGEGLPSSVVENDEKGESENQQTRVLPRNSASILHRSNSASWLAEDFADILKPEPKSMDLAFSEMGIRLFRLAFELASETTIDGACRTALAFLESQLPLESGGILGRIKQSSQAKRNATSLSVIATSQSSGLPYHRIDDALAATVLQDQEALLVRGIPASVNEENAKPDSSSDAMICAPIIEAGTTFGLIHLIGATGETSFDRPALELTMAVAQTLAVAFKNLGRQQKLKQKLKATQEEVDSLKSQIAGQVTLVGDSPALQTVQAQIIRVAPSNATVLIRGESGVGKDLVARSIHLASPRAKGPFVAMNCAALTTTLLESELFGHEKGAFTGAVDRKIGKFEQADGGTLMLDEIGEMSAEIQAKFLRVLEGQAFERVGGREAISVDVRVVAATNRDLEEAVKEGEFRADLYFRLRVIELFVPALRDRREDIVPLAEHFLKRLTTQIGHGPTGFDQAAMKLLREYSWPGNIRELRNAVERATILATSELATPADLALSHVAVPGQTSVALSHEVYRERSLAEIEKEHILATLRATDGHKSRTAAILGVERSTLDRKLKRFGISDVNDL